MALVKRSSIRATRKYRPFRSPSKLVATSQGEVEELNALEDIVINAFRSALTTESGKKFQSVIRNTLNSVFSNRVVMGSSEKSVILVRGTKSGGGNKYYSQLDISDWAKDKFFVEFVFEIDWNRKEGGWVVSFEMTPTTSFDNPIKKPYETMNLIDITLKYMYFLGDKPLDNFETQQKTEGLIKELDLKFGQIYKLTADLLNPENSMVHKQAQKAFAESKRVRDKVVKDKTVLDWVPPYYRQVIIDRIDYEETIDIIF